jgi:glycosyltransferase involved in cell wall biosynthesis
MFNCIVSLILPVRNEEKYIEKCLNSLLSQTFDLEKSEIIVVDGKSNDRTQEIVQDYSRKYSNIKLLTNEKKIAPTAMNNGIKNYIVIDCRYSTYEWIKSSIIKSNLLSLLNMRISDIDWNKCNEYSRGSQVKKAAELWNEHTYNTSEIACIMKLNKSTIEKYLIQATECGICDYYTEFEKLKRIKKQGNILCRKSVICLTTGDIYNSMAEVERLKIISHSGVSDCCRGIVEYAGKLPDGTKLKWMYYEDYLKNEGCELDF